MTAADGTPVSAAALASARAAGPALLRANPPSATAPPSVRLAVDVSNAAAPVMAVGPANARAYPLAPCTRSVWAPIARLPEANVLLAPTAAVTRLTSISDTGPPPATGTSCGAVPALPVPAGAVTTTLLPYASVVLVAASALSLRNSCPPDSRNVADPVVLPDPSADRVSTRSWFWTTIVPAKSLASLLRNRAWALSGCRRGSTDTVSVSVAAVLDSLPDSVS